jgi:hypothetical protein
VADLEAAVSRATSGQTIVIQPGIYRLRRTLWVNGPHSHVTIRGASSNRNDTVLAGPGMGVPSDSVPFGIWTGGGVSHLTIANLTIRDVYQHPVVFNAGTESPRLYNVRIADGGQQLVKANPDEAGSGVDAGIVEYSVLEYTRAAPTAYTNGIDVHAGRGWIIRHNLFRRIRAGDGGLAGPAILMWNGASGTIVDGNTFIDCQREISFGLTARTPDDHSGGIIRNNFITRGAGRGGDVAIAVFDSPATTVAHNTIWLDGTYDYSVESRFAGARGVNILNNLSDRPARNRDGGTSTERGNVWSAVASWFVNAAAGDLHLRPSAAGVSGVAAPATDVPLDWDGDPRPGNRLPDAGADQRAVVPPAGQAPVRPTGRSRRRPGLSTADAQP